MTRQMAAIGVLLLSLLGPLASLPRACAGLIIDDFSHVEVGTTQSAVDMTADGWEAFDEDDGLGNVLGASRDIRAWVGSSSGGSDIASATVDQNTRHFVVSVLTPGTYGGGAIDYDGRDGSYTIATQGLRQNGVGVDLTQSGANDRIRVSLGAVTGGWLIEPVIWTSHGTGSKGKSIGTGDAYKSVDFLFSEFVPPGAAYTDVGAISIEFIKLGASASSIEVVSVVGVGNVPEPSMIIMLLGLGAAGLLWWRTRAR